MEYVVVEASTAEELSARVGERLAHGWVPHGSLSVVVSRNNRWYYYQPLTRTPADAPNPPPAPR